MTITEALAEIKTITKRRLKKEQAVMQHLARQEMLKDPMAREPGGSAGFVERQRQGIIDLNERIVMLRNAIAATNARTMLTIAGTTRPVADWLVWRREVAPVAQGFLNQINTRVQAVRREAQQKGVNVLSAAAAVQVGETKPQDVVVNVDEAVLSAEMEQIEEILGTLDGKLSLVNATTNID